jgi:hypothetical protein
MATSPYRDPASRPEEHAPRADSPIIDDGEIVPVLALVWIASILRLIQGLSRGETFGAELTLVCFAIVVLPLAAKEGIGSLLGRLRRGRPMSR